MRDSTLNQLGRIAHLLSQSGRDELTGAEVQRERFDVGELLAADVVERTAGGLKLSERGKLTLESLASGPALRGVSPGDRLFVGGGGVTFE